jgi:hypothetical protein
MVVEEPSHLFPALETFDRVLSFEKIKERHARQILLRKTSTDGITFLEMHLYMQVSLFEPFRLLLQRHLRTIFLRHPRKIFKSFLPLPRESFRFLFTHFLSVLWVD